MLDTGQSESLDNYLEELEQESSMIKTEASQDIA